MSESKDQFSFNLINNDWVPCRMAQGNNAKLEYFGLAKLFEQARLVREIVGDSPPVTIALYRLLLAIVHRSLGPLSYHGEWQAYWRNEQSFQDGVAAYLKRAEIAERFDLFHSTHPFYQSSKAIEPRETINQDYWGKLLFQDPGSALLFEHLAATDPPSLTPAQAARWLIALQSFDTGGTKTAEEDKDYTSPAPLLLAATGLVCGRNLFETLMLNLYWSDLPHFKDYGDPAKDKPAWERDAPDSFTLRPPDGYLDLLTWQSRRIRLRGATDEEDRVVIRKVVIMAGYEIGATTKLKGKQQKKKTKEKETSYELVGKEPMMAFIASRSANARRGFEPLGFLFLLFTFELRCCAYLIPCHNHYLSDYDAFFLICGAAKPSSTTLPSQQIQVTVRRAQRKTIRGVALPGRFVFRRVAIIFEMREVAPIEIEHQRLKKISATYQPRSRQQQRRWRGVVLVFLCRLGATRIE